MVGQVGVLGLEARDIGAGKGIGRGDGDRGVRRCTAAVAGRVAAMP